MKLLDCNKNKKLELLEKYKNLKFIKLILKTTLFVNLNLKIDCFISFKDT